MTEPKYLLIRPNEDGKPNAFLTAEELKPYLEGEDGYGEIMHWLTLEEVLKDPSAAYQEDGNAALFEIRLIQPQRTKGWVIG